MSDIFLASSDRHGWYTRHYINGSFLWFLDCSVWQRMILWMVCHDKSILLHRHDNIVSIVRLHDCVALGHCPSQSEIHDVINEGCDVWGPDLICMNFSMVAPENPKSKYMMISALQERQCYIPNMGESKLEKTDYNLHEGLTGSVYLLSGFVLCFEVADNKPQDIPTSFLAKTHS